MQRKADKSISIKGKNLSSIFVPDIRKSFAYGDFGGTNDALLFVFHNLSTPNGVIEAGGVIEIFIARGQSNNQKQLYNLLADGELDEEMNKLRNQVAKSATYTQNRENTLY